MADEIEWSCDDIAPDSKLPGDVMVSILTYLPVKSLLKFKSVSKPWCSLISSPRFFKLHLLRQSLASKCLVSVKDDFEDGSDGEDEDEDDLDAVDRKLGLLDLTHHYDSPADDDVSVLEIPPFDFGVIDSCNGLVLIAGYAEIILWNPATRRYRSLDLPKGDYLNNRTLGLCYVDAINDFKILAWNHSHYPSPVFTPYLYVYSLSSNSWKKLDFHAPKTNIRLEPPTFIGRCMHWLAHTCCNGVNHACMSATEIVAFDVMDGAMSSFHLPVSCCRRSVIDQQTLVIRGCLSIVIEGDTVGGARKFGFGVWVMEEYGVEGSWVKRFFIQEEEFISATFPLRSWNYGEIVFNIDSDVSKVLILFDPYTGKKRYVEFSSYHIKKFFNYVESLASVGTSLRGGPDVMW